MRKRCRRWDLWLVFGVFSAAQFDPVAFAEENYSLPALHEGGLTLLFESLGHGIREIPDHHRRYSFPQGGAKSQGEGDQRLFYIDYTEAEISRSPGESFSIPNSVTWNVIKRYQIPIDEMKVLFGPRFLSNIGSGQHPGEEILILNKADFRFRDTDFQLKDGILAARIDGKLRLFLASGLTSLTDEGDPAPLGLEGVTGFTTDEEGVRTSRSAVVRVSQLLDREAFYEGWKTNKVYLFGPDAIEVYPIWPTFSDLTDENKVRRFGAPVVVVTREAVEGGDKVKLWRVAETTLSFPVEESSSSSQRQGGDEAMAKDPRAELITTIRLPDLRHSDNRLTYLTETYRPGNDLFKADGTGKCIPLVAGNAMMWIKRNILH